MRRRFPVRRMRWTCRWFNHRWQHRGLGSYCSRCYEWKDRS